MLYRLTGAVLAALMLAACATAARYMLQLMRADSTFAAIRSLMQIDNPREVKAVGASGVSCVTGFRF